MTSRTRESSESSASAEWAASPTRNDSTQDTEPHDLNGIARASVGDPALVFSEGIEECIRAFYVVMRRKGLTRAEQDAIVLVIRAELTRL